MTPIAIVALLGLAFLIPILTNDDDTDLPVDPVDLIDPVDPVIPTPVPGVVDGTVDADTLTAANNQSVNGYSGEDTITAGADVTGAEIDGGRDNDTITLEGTENSADGYRGNDTFDISGTGNTANGGDGSDIFSVNATNASINGGSGNDEILVAEDSRSVLVNGGQGEDRISGSGQNITLNGNAGNDVIGYSAGGGVANGGGGDDTISAIAIDRGFGGRSAMLLDGGLGNDDLTTNIAPNEVTYADTLTGGAGSDVFNIDMGIDGSPNRTSDEGFVTITDFNSEEDRLQISIATSTSSGFLLDGLEFVEAADGSYTDIISTFTSTTAGVADTVSTIRVLGATDLGPDDIFLDTGFNATEGDDILSALTAEQPTPGVIDGLGGDDLIVHDASDDVENLILRGGEGSDTLIAEELDVSLNTTLDGGVGDDVLRTNIGVLGSFETFIMGEGSDTIEISVRNGGPTSIADAGLFGQVTDFTPGEDTIVLDSSSLLANTSGGFAEGFTQTLTLTEADLGFTISAPTS